MQVCWQNREITVVSDSLQLARCVEYRKHGVRATVKRWCIHAQFIKCVISVLLYKWKLLRGPQEYRQVMTVWSATQWEWHTHTMPRSARLEGLPSIFTLHLTGLTRDPHSHSGCSLGHTRWNSMERCHQQSPWIRTTIHHAASQEDSSSTHHSSQTPVTPPWSLIWPGSYS